MKTSILTLFLLTCTIAISQSDGQLTITKVPSEVDGLTKVGNIAVSASIPFAGQKKLRQKAREKLMAEAVALKADIVFVTIDEFAMTPINNVNMEGVAYKYPAGKRPRKAAATTAGAKPKAAVNASDNWNKVLVTKDINDVKGMKKVKEYSVSSSAPFAGQKKLREKAREKIQKEAVADNCTVVLINTDEFSMSPINTINLIGIGYKR